MMMMISPIVVVQQNVGSRLYDFLLMILWCKNKYPHKVIPDKAEVSKFPNCLNQGNTVQTAPFILGEAQFDNLFLNQSK